MARIDFKETVWREVRIPDDILEKYQPLFEDGRIDSMDALISTITPEEFRQISTELMDETTEALSLDDNDFDATIEIISGPHYDIVWHNGKDRSNN